MSCRIWTGGLLSKFYHSLALNEEKKIKENLNQTLPVKVNNNDSNKMIDFLIVVDDSLRWHEENLKRNRSHYSILKYFGARMITKLQEDFGANCYFNTLIPINNQTLISLFLFIFILVVDYRNQFKLFHLIIHW